MPKLHGKDWRIFIDSLDISGVSNQTTVTSETDYHDVTTYLDESTTIIPGLKDWQAEVLGWFDASGASRFEANIYDHLAGSAIVGAFPQGPHDGRHGYEGLAWHALYEIGGAPDVAVTVQHLYEGGGRLSRTMVLAACAGVTASGTGTPYQVGANTLAAGFVRVSAITGSASFEVQHSGASDGTFAPLVEFTDFSGSGAEAIWGNVSPSAWARAKWVVDGEASFIVSAESYYDKYPDQLYGYLVTADGDFILTAAGEFIKVPL